MGWTFTAIAAAIIVAGLAFYRPGPLIERTPTTSNPAATAVRAPAPVLDETVGTPAAR
jgi:hypothetical protein